MALLHELFSSKRKVCTESRDSARPYKITKEQVRLLLFKECDWRGRKLLFDSSTIDKVPIDKNAKSYTKLAGGSAPCVVEVSEGFAYQYKGPAADAAALGEMMFGAVAMSYKGVSLKIHILEEPHRYKSLTDRLMLTKVFGVPPLPRAAERACSGSTPRDVPSAAGHGVSLSFSFDRGDSGFYTERSPGSSVSSSRDYCSIFEAWDRDAAHDDLYSFHTPPSGRKLSACSNGSWQRRMFRNLSTRFDLQGLQSGNLLAVPSVATTHSQACGGSDSSATCDSLSSASSGGSARRRTKLALALLITLADDTHMDMLRYCAEHSPQLEALICRLRMSVMLSGVQRSDGPRFVATLVRATADAVHWLMLLLHGPRLRPAWLELVAAPAAPAAPAAAAARHRLAETLVADVCHVLHAADTKHTNFFISTLLTHVLTYHLGWVSTVSPYESAPAAGARAPYDALWAQLGDLAGSIGCPARAARTVVSGKDRPFVSRLLAVLTYFVRCGDVRRHLYSGGDFEPATDFRVTSVPVSASVGLKKSATRGRLDTDGAQCAPSALVVNNSSLTSSSTALPEELSVGNLNVSELNNNEYSKSERYANATPMASCLKRTSTVMHSLLTSEQSEPSDASDDAAREPKSVVFVLGDDDKLIGLKNKSVGGKRIKKTSKCALSDAGESDEASLACDQICDSSVRGDRSSVSPSRCCGQQSQHSKPIKHSGFKFDFDKYPQIVTNYMKSKNLEILDRHYIGKPGNLKLDNFQFDPTAVAPIQEERCENCYRCRTNESTLQTPTNASELWSDTANEERAHDAPAPPYARADVVREGGCAPPKFVRKRKENTVVINLPAPTALGVGETEDRRRRGGSDTDPPTKHLRVIEVGMPRTLAAEAPARDSPSGFHCSLLGGLTDHYVPDMILQGTLATPDVWEADVRRDLELATHINKSHDTPLQAVAVVADCDQWLVRVLSSGGGGGAAGGEGGGGMSTLVGAMLDALPHMRRARVPAHQCLSFVESKLRELCVLSKTLADLLMSCDLCDMDTLTGALNVDADDVPLLLAVATTHTPSLARRYGISYR